MMMGVDGLSDLFEASQKIALRQNCSKDISFVQLDIMMKLLRKYIGRYVLYYKMEGNKMQPPILAQISYVSKVVVTLRTKCYDSDGVNCGYLTRSFTTSDVYCKNVVLKVFGDI